MQISSFLIQNSSFKIIRHLNAKFTPSLLGRRTCGPCTCNQREIYQAPACIYNAIRERSINPQHVYTMQSERGLSSAGMYIQCNQREIYQSPACLYKGMSGISCRASPAPPALRRSSLVSPRCRHETATSHQTLLSTCRPAPTGCDDFAFKSVNNGISSQSMMAFRT